GSGRHPRDRAATALTVSVLLTSAYGGYFDVLQAVDNLTSALVFVMISPVAWRVTVFLGAHQISLAGRPWGNSQLNTEVLQDLGFQPLQFGVDSLVRGPAAGGRHAFGRPYGRGQLLQRGLRVGCERGVVLGRLGGAPQVSECV